MQPTAEQLEMLVQRIRDAVHPLRIILFGSAARGDMGPASDIDVLVVMPDGAHRLKTSQTIYRHLLGLRLDIDVVVATESDVRAYHDSPGLIYREALREGKELYAA